MATTGGVLLSDELLRLRELVSEADGIELKVTVPEVAHRSTTVTLGLDPIDAQIRHVYFFDTPDLALNKVGVVVRARRIQGGGNDSVVKLRPVVPERAPERHPQVAELQRRGGHRPRQLRVLRVAEEQAPRHRGPGLGVR